MKKGNVILPIVLGLLAVALMPKAWAQDIVKEASVAGTWDVTITESARARATVGAKTKEQWILEQKGKTFTGKAKTSNGEMNLEGNVGGLSGDAIEVHEKNGDNEFIIKATVDNDVMGGTIRSYKDKTERLWNAKRTK